MAWFPGFKPIRITTSGAEINGVVGGSGPPVLLLHGWPQTHLDMATRRAGAGAALHCRRDGSARYGDSSKPPEGDESRRLLQARDGAGPGRSHAPARLRRFAVVGHDRGGRVACRMALDHPQAVTRLALLDIVPTRTVYTEVSKNLATWYFHWFFLIQPAPLPEMLLAGPAEPFLRNFAFRGLIPDAIDEAVFAEYVRCFSDPQTLHAMCEDYRAGASIDLQHDEADLATRLHCPTLVLWGARRHASPLRRAREPWRPRAPDAQGEALPAGHWLPEECPQEVTAALGDFLA